MLEKIAIKNAFTCGFIGFFLNNNYLIRKNLKTSLSRLAANIGPEEYILDYGCGSKPYQFLFQSSNYIGVDVERSGHPAGSKKADIYFDSSQVPLPDRTFDVVLASEVFEHIFELDDSLVDIFRLLKPGGKLIATCPFLWPLHEEPYDHARYTPHALNYILKKVGFQNIHIEKIGHDVETLAEITNAYMALKFVPKIPVLSRIASITYNTIFHTLGTVGRILPKTQTIYLSNIITAERP